MIQLTLDEVKAQVLVGSVIVVGPGEGQWRIEHGRVPGWAKVDNPPTHWRDPAVWPSSWLTYDLGRETSLWVIGFAVRFKLITGCFPSEAELDWLEQKSTSLRAAEDWLIAALNTH